LALVFQCVLLFSTIDPIDDKGLRRSHKIQGLPPKGYQPLPPNPPEDNYHREVENQSDAGIVIAPSLDNSEGALVTVENTITSVSVTPPIFRSSMSSVDKQSMTTSYSIDISLKTDLSINDKFM
jgi:hypothetical protein